MKWNNYETNWNLTILNILNIFNRFNYLYLRLRQKLAC